jgi:hypothetical protein
MELFREVRLRSKAIWAVAAAGLAAVAAAQVIVLGEDEIGPVVVKLAWLGNEGCWIFGFYVGRHTLFSLILSRLFTA